MFKCQRCNQLSELGEKATYVTVERRSMEYENYITRGRRKGEIRITKGWEIVKEITICPRCAANDLSLKEPKQPKEKVIEKRNWTSRHNLNKRSYNGRH